MYSRAAGKLKDRELHLVLCEACRCPIAGGLLVSFLQLRRTKKNTTKVPSHLWLKNKRLHKSFFMLIITLSSTLPVEGQNLNGSQLFIRMCVITFLTLTRLN